MKFRVIWAVILALTGWNKPLLGLEQSQNKSDPEFEAADIEVTNNGPHDPSGLLRAPGQVVYKNYSLLDAVAEAYHLKPYQILAQPRLKTRRINITAKAPRAVSRDQLRAMLRTLLASDLGFVAHHETRDLPFYDLVLEQSGAKVTVASANGSATGSPVEPTPRFQAPKENEAGFPVVPDFAGEGTRFMAFGNGKASILAKRESMPDFAQFLTGQLQYVVRDSTGLRASYDFRLYWFSPPDTPTRTGPVAVAVDRPALSGMPVASAADEGPMMFEALRVQLGLKLELKKGPVDVLVIDNMKEPNRN